MKRHFVFILILALSMSINADDNKMSQKEAREIFNKTYDLVFGKNGSSLSYDVDIIGIYKTKGDIIYKGDKIKYTEERYLAWEDGKTAYMVDTKKKTVNIYDFNDDSKDEYLAKFKYDINNFDFSCIKSGANYELTAKVKKGKYFGIRQVTALIRQKDLTPLSLTIKAAFFNCKVKVSKFHAGGIR